MNFLVWYIISTYKVQNSVIGLNVKCFSIIFVFLFFRLRILYPSQSLSMSYRNRLPRQLIVYLRTNLSASMSVSRDDSPSTEQRKRYVEIIIILEKLVDLNEHTALKKYITTYCHLLTKTQNFYPGCKQVKLLQYNEYNLLNDNTVISVMLQIYSQTIISQ